MINGVDVLAKPLVGDSWGAGERGKNRLRWRDTLYPLERLRSGAVR